MAGVPSILWRVALALVVLAITASPAAGAERLRGVHSHSLWWEMDLSEVEREFDALAAAGGNAVRVDLGWASLETAGDERYSSWYENKIDKTLAAAESRGIKVLAMVHETPCWASSAPESLKQGCRGDWWGRGVTAYPPKDAGKFAEAVAFIAKRWGHRLAAIEIWNEPNEASQRFLRSDDPAKAYARLLRAAYPAIKAEAPDLKVIGGAISWSDINYLKRLYEEGIGGNFDAFSIHPYNEWRDPYDPWLAEFRKHTFITGVPAFHAAMAAHGDGDKGLWLSEFGFSTCDGGRQCVSESQQARYLERSFEIVRGWSFVEAAFAYEMRDSGTDRRDPEARYGVLNRDFSPKPGLDGLRRGFAALGGDVAARVAAAPVAIRGSRVRASKGSARIRVTCLSQSSSCSGRLVLRTRGRRAHRAVGRIRVRAGRRGTVRVRLPRSFVRTLARKRRISALATVSGGTKRRVTVLAPRR